MASLESGRTTRWIPFGMRRSQANHGSWANSIVPGYHCPVTKENNCIIPNFRTPFLLLAFKMAQGFVLVALVLLGFTKPK